MFELTEEQLKKINQVVHQDLDFVDDHLAAGGEEHHSAALEVARQVFTLSSYEDLQKALDELDDDLVETLLEVELD